MLARHGDDMLDIKERLGTLEMQSASLSRRLDRIEARLDRIVRRLDLVGGRGCARPGRGPPMRLAHPRPDAPARIEGQIASGRAAFTPDHPNLPDVLAARTVPHLVEVQRPGRIVPDAVAVTRPNGRHTRVWLSATGTFALIVDGRSGAPGITVHGPAPACFASV